MIAFLTAWLDRRIDARIAASRRRAEEEGRARPTYAAHDFLPFGRQTHASAPAPTPTEARVG